MKTALFVVGSFRAKSFNRQLAREAEALIAPRAKVEWLDFRDVPFMNQDAENPAPETVAKARKAVLAADGVWFFTPEYNFSYPGLLKNLLDWLSRPRDPSDRTSPSVLAARSARCRASAGATRRPTAAGSSPTFSRSSVCSSSATGKSASRSLNSKGVCPLKKSEPESGTGETS